MTLLEIDELLDSTTNFDAYIEDIGSLDRQVVDLMQTVLDADGASLNNMQILAYIEELMDAAKYYKARKEGK